MKKYYVLLFLFCCVNNLWAQFKLSGKITHYSGQKELKINIPSVYVYNEANSVIIPIAKDGSFAVTLPIKTQKFGNLIFQQTFYLLLLNQNKNLVVELNEIDKQFKPTGGNALAENNLLQTVNIDEYPFFLQNYDTYINMSIDALNQKVVKPYFATRDKKIALINSSGIGLKDKKIIAAETKYAAYNNLYELTEQGSQNMVTINKLLFDVFSKVSSKPDVLPAGPQYYLFANNYMGCIEHTVGGQIKTGNIKPDQSIAYYGVTAKEAVALSDKYGSPYMRWTSACKLLPSAVAEQLGYQYFTTAAGIKNAILANVLANEFVKKFPRSAYNDEIRKKANALKPN
ncbi:MAG: hypothetical protein JWR50_689 [Mucilaginibacter sp.]|nr:hypothetical protein [Mucilaginibacter sp.]